MQESTSAFPNGHEQKTWTYPSIPLEKSPKTSIYSNRTDGYVPQPFTFVDCIAKQCLIEIGQRFEDFAKYVDELGEETKEDGEYLFNCLIRTGQWNI